MSQVVSLIPHDEPGDVALMEGVAAQARLLRRAVPLPEHLTRLLLQLEDGLETHATLAIADDVLAGAEVA